MAVIQKVRTKATNHIQVRSTKLKPKLEYYAKLDQTSLSSLVNQALEQYIALREQNNPPRNPLAHWKGKGEEKGVDEFEKLTHYLQENKTLTDREYEFN